MPSPSPSRRPSRLVMIGGGYVGLVSGACLAAFGADVTIVEQDRARLEKLTRAEIPIYEPGLEELAKRQSAAGRLRFTGNLQNGLADADAVFIAVGTPTRRGSGHADLSYVHQVAREIAQQAQRGLLVVTKSTVPVGTGREVARILRDVRPDLSFTVASNPEFLREGNAVADFMSPDRVIVGIDENAPGASDARGFLTDLYCSAQPGEPGIEKNRLAFMGLESAELAKYAANAFLALKVTFINEMADLCETTGANITEVAHGMGLDPRISPHFLDPGPGYGGSCFPKDTRALATTARQAGAPAQLVEATIAANKARKRRLAERILALAGRGINDMTIAVLGLAFKADTDDVRDAPALTILPILADSGAKLRVYDPQAMAQARPRLPAAVLYAESVEEALTNADMLVLLTEWPLFRALTPARLAALMTGRTIVDYRNLWNPGSLREAGFVYYGLGRA